MSARGLCHFFNRLPPVSHLARSLALYSFFMFIIGWWQTANVAEIGAKTFLARGLFYL